MKWNDLFKQAVQALRVNMTRAILTVLGLSIGVGACIAIGSLGSAAVTQVRAEMDRFGVDRIWVSELPGNGVRMAERDLMALRELSDAVAPVCKTAARASAGTKTKACALIATDEQYAVIEEMHISDGRFLLPQDGQNRLRTAVIEDILEAELFGSGSAVGERITLGAFSYTVVGVLKTQRDGYFTTGSATPKVYVPLETYLSLTGETAYDELIMQTGESGVRDAAVQAKQALLAAHAPGDGFSITSMAEQIASADRILDIVTTVLIVVGVICMVTGGVGVMNVMLTGVRERRREIGVRKALGALDKEIFLQFLCESSLYGVLGAVCGVGLGALLTSWGQNIIGIAAKPELWVMVLSITFSCMVGTISGVYPAIRAMRVLPVTAMRQM